MPLASLVVSLGVTGQERVKAALEQTQENLHATGKSAQTAGGHLKAFGGHFVTLGLSAFRAIGMMSGVGAAVAGVGIALAAGLGKQAFEASASLDSLTRGLASRATDAADLTAQLGRLKEVAKLPGLSFEEAVKGSVTLQAAGLSANLAERSLSAFGNALATVGKGKEELNGVVTALSQIQSKGAISAEEIGQLAERIPQIRQFMKGAFGTSDTEVLSKSGMSTSVFIEKLVAEAEKAPKVLGGIKNAMENMVDGVNRAIEPLGRGLGIAFEAAAPEIEKFFGNLTARLTEVGEVFAALGKSGVIADVLQKLTTSFNGMFGTDFQAGVVRATAMVASIVGNLPETLKQLGGYVSALFASIANNIGQAFTYFSSLLTNLGAKLTIILGTGAMALQAAERGQFATASELMQNIPMSMNTVNGFLPVKDPKYMSLPKIPDVIDPRKDAERYEKMLGGNLGRLPNQPNNLIFGTGSEASADGKPSTDKILDKALAALEKIQSNTRSAAEDLSLRRQALGGGKIGALGVTAAEAGSGYSAGMAGSRTGPAKVGTSAGMAASQLEKLLMQLIDNRMASANGGGFRPR